jgi:hypothetical protein
MQPLRVDWRRSACLSVPESRVDCLEACIASFEEADKKYEAEVTGVTAMDMTRIMQGVPDDDQETRRERQVDSTVANMFTVNRV